MSYVATSPIAGPPGVRVSRSAATRRVFEGAAAQTSPVDLFSLLRSLLNAQNPQVEEITAAMQPALAAILKELQETETQTSPLTVTMDQRLRDLDATVSEFRPTPRVAESIDANVAIRPEAAPDLTERLAFLSELTWEFGTPGLLDPMLRKAVEQLLRIVSQAERCAILVKEAGGNELLLRAHGPVGTTPMVSMTSVRRAMTEQKGFIWTRGDDLSLSQKESDVRVRHVRADGGEHAGDRGNLSGLLLHAAQFHAR